jgi:CRP/FNR family cyclic AMP-dependent transcriptional regulator
MAGKDPKLDLLQSIPIFSKCGRSGLKKVAKLVDEVELPDGHVIMREGETGNEMFLIVSGKARADRKGRKLAVLGPGAAFGEMALIAEGKRNATVTADGPLRVFVVGHREFHSLMDSHPGFRMQILEGLANKVRDLEKSAIN